MFSRSISPLDTRRLVAAGITMGMLIAAVGVFAFTALALNARTAVGAGGPGCFSTGPVCTFRGTAASSDFGTVSADECVFTDIFVNAIDSLTTPNRQATKTVFVFMSKFNGCTGESLLSASNFDPTTGTSVFNGTFQIGTSLDTATAIGSAPMFDNSTGAQIFTSTINVTWRGYGAATTFIDSSHHRMPGFLMNSHFHGTTRSAEASGVVTDAAGSNLAAQPTLYASLQNNSSGTVQLSHS
jgi:hypothetical protein